MKKKYQYAVLIGRFEPFHNEHLRLVQHCFSQADETILVLGSHRSAPNYKNPWSAKDREEMIRDTLSTFQECPPVHYVHVRDQMYNDDLWLAETQQKIKDITGSDDSKICLCGHFKDDTSFYLNFFPQWKFEGTGEKTNKDISATKCRESFFGDTDDWYLMVPPTIVRWLEGFKKKPIFKAIQEEKAYVDGYKKSWEGSPFPPIFVTVDIVVIKSGHVLMVRRGAAPGKGLLALPGGFVNSDERIQRAALRELKEETKLMVEPDIVRASIASKEVFDYPNRSLRGRTITHSFYIRLQGGGPLPEVKGGDDAVAARWVPLGDLYLMEDQIFEDHLHQIEHFIRKF